MTPDASEADPVRTTFEAILHSLKEHICVLDEQGVIEWTNVAWRHFAVENGGDPAATGTGSQYLGVCTSSAAGGDSDAAEARNGIRAVLDDHRTEFEFEYPCDSPDEQRWFLMRVTRLADSPQTRLVISHHDITARKLAEQKVERLARLDGLTGVANRRWFDEVLEAELRRVPRLEQPVSLVLVDIDSFKLFNDLAGHQAGDSAIQQVAGLLASCARRAGDLVARYGGDELAVVLPSTPLDDAVRFAERVRNDVRRLGIEHPDPEIERLTVSIGVAASGPSADTAPAELVSAADAALYTAKAAGRDRVAGHSQEEPG